MPARDEPPPTRNGPTRASRAATRGGRDRGLAVPPRARAVSFVVWAGTVLIAGLSLWTLAGAFHWSGDLLADYRWQLGWLSLVAAGCASGVRAWAPSGLLFALCVVHLWGEMSLSVPSQEVFASSSRLRVATLSSGFGPEARAALVRWFDEEQPDVALVCRVDGEGLAALAEREDGSLVATWPPAEGWSNETIGRGLWVREGLQGLENRTSDGLLDATLAVGERRLRVLGLRPPHAQDAASAARRDDLFERAAEAASADGSVVVLGDLGATTYSRAFQRLLLDGGLADSRQGFGRQATWASDLLPLGFLLGVDHVLVGDDLRCVARGHHWDVESDHQPVLAELVWSDATTDR